jgi:hypothetical protein
MAHMSPFVWLDWPISWRDEDHAEPHFQCKAINAGRITSLRAQSSRPGTYNTENRGFDRPWPFGPESTQPCTIISGTSDLASSRFRAFRAAANHPRSTTKATGSKACTMECCVLTRIDSLARHWGNYKAYSQFSDRISVTVPISFESHN